jgi:Domain of unknown function (DUF4926)
VETYGRVRLTTDRYRAEGAPLGAVGYVIEAYADGAYEIEISGVDGVTVAQVVAREDELEQV